MNFLAYPPRPTPGDILTDYLIGLTQVDCTIASEHKFTPISFPPADLKLSLALQLFYLVSHSSGDIPCLTTNCLPYFFLLGKISQAYSVLLAAGFRLLLNGWEAFRNERTPVFYYDLLHTKAWKFKRMNILERMFMQHPNFLWICAQI